LCVFVCGSFTFGQNIPVRTNVEIIDELISVMMMPVFTEIEGGSAVSLSVRFPEYDWFVRHRLAVMLENEGFTVYTGNQVNEVVAALEIGVEKLTIRYGKTYGGGLWGTRMVERSAAAVFSVGLTVGGEESVIRRDGTIRDDIPVKYINAVENNALPFTRDVHPGGTVLDRFIAPAIILSVTAAVVYLFFSVRS
jgi:hypothetical protein